MADMLQKSGVRKNFAQKVLDAAAESGTISFKDFGKQRVYLAKQSDFQIPTQEELDAMKKSNENLIAEAKSAKETCTALEVCKDLVDVPTNQKTLSLLILDYVAAIKDLKSSLTQDQIEERIESLTVEARTITLLSPLRKSI